MFVIRESYIRIKDQSYTIALDELPNDSNGVWFRLPKVFKYKRFIRELTSFWQYLVGSIVSNFI